MPEDLQKRQFVKITDLPRQRSDRFISAYANHVEANQSFFDLQLTFCQISRDDQGKPSLEEQASIAFSWEQIVRLRDLLDILVQDYEKDAGQIRKSQDPKPTDIDFGDLKIGEGPAGLLP